MPVLKGHPHLLLRFASVGTPALPVLWIQDNSLKPLDIIRKLLVVPQKNALLDSIAPLEHK